MDLQLDVFRNPNPPYSSGLGTSTEFGSLTQEVASLGRIQPQPRTNISTTHTSSVLLTVAKSVVYSLVYDLQQSVNDQQVRTILYIFPLEIYHEHAPNIH
ncbi:hypothetical protein Pcinc_012805 [Petrolisthes cinctipes]|uniref:Uncharacterized protein n=1 Tax=Petrolisthes cinctipes TaxID=88211 RepID=A0AAE1KT92_PETCI|nr:hypothetical protein Pcinc_012805 [Petrolisthes cinctipes]